MPRDLFGNVIRPSITVGNRKWYTVPVSLFSHSALLLLVVAVPILAAPLLPSVLANDNPAYLITVLPPPPPPPLANYDRHVEPQPDRNAVPIEAPTGIAKEPDRPPDLHTSDTPGLIGGSENLDTVLAPPPALTKVEPQKPVRAGVTVRQPQKLNDVNPVYPPIAQSARVQGIVIIEATIGEDGHVTNARILRSVPLLDQAALDAVRQWEYTPTTLNGVPVPVIMTVTVQFTLAR